MAATPQNLPERFVIEEVNYTDEQIKDAVDALRMYEAGPVNPMGVSLTLNRMFKNEFDATHSTSAAAECPAAYIVFAALGNIMGLWGCVDTIKYQWALEECRNRAAWAWTVEGYENYEVRV